MTEQTTHHAEHLATIRHVYIVRDHYSHKCIVYCVYALKLLHCLSVREMAYEDVYRALR